MMRTVLDPLSQLNFGSLEKGHTYLVVGERGSGKTLFCMLAALLFALKSSRVVYVLTQGELCFRLAERLIANHGLPNRILENILFMEPHHRSSEAYLPALLEETRPSAFIFDEINWGYTSYVAGNLELAVYRNRLLSNLLAEIHGVCRSFECTTIYTADILSGGGVLAHNALTYFCDITVELRRLKRGYRASLISGGSRLKSYPYTIGRLGFQIGEAN